MKTSEIRQAFLQYFASQGHEIVPSSSLVPGNDPTLLFTNAGMVQFKDVFLGREQRQSTRATSSQRCVRAGGKHNDLENVGYTARHHTFFEMLGNFSFGDYFKEDAIRFAWEFLTGVMKLPKEKLWITVYQDDQEAEKIWLETMGVDPERFSRLGADSNFWQMGDTGPCGPCTEIFYDHGADVWGGPPGSPEEDGDRYIEIWNLVFMQYDRQPDGELQPLPKPSVDTGMGLERIAAVMQSVHSNYEIDLFVNLLNAAAKVIGTQDLEEKSLRVVADHIRSCAFLITDGVMPSNEGRGYVLRRILRRAIRHGNKLGMKDLFFYKLVKPLVLEMGDAYPELRQAQTQIEKILKLEEEQFAKTLEQGLRILDQELESLQAKQIPGDLVFKLYDTYGFPADLTADIARERELTIDQTGFEQAMHQQKSRSKEAGKFKSGYHDGIEVLTATGFTGYQQSEAPATITELFVGGVSVAQVMAGQEAIIVLDSTPFYAESGGQIGDVGFINSADASFEVIDTGKERQAHLHHGVMTSGSLQVGDAITAVIDNSRRQAIRLNHSATHLMHAALRMVLGSHVTQKGSLVGADRLRFDFTHMEPMKPEEIRAVERLVNEQIRGNSEVSTELMAIDDAKACGAMALFGEKYDDEVRVLTMGQDRFSIELCGGTHVARTGDIGVFRIISETGVAAGIRRIEAVSGQAAMDWIDATEDTVDAISSLLKTNREQVLERVQQSLDRVKILEKELERQKAKLASSAGDELLQQVKDVAGVKVLSAEVDGVDPKALRDMVDKLKDKLGSGIIVLGLGGEKANLVAGVTKDLTSKVKAGDLVNHVAQQLGGRGGGRPDLAMAGGPNVANLAVALGSVENWVSEKLN
ncbi:alanine--tRNA ligase [Ketobacter sp. MCCC 1A13808]|uniref:alanine--tRNA ligase n=1 Tax=Ketobacter sp. MCCC 1A13808 TaxID=2602738 RepID=UPI000F25A963|nr:alanine--tRNA ligase [Ketobacter sp. MCCC 1A13808]MVF12790.1 alanine--tRNA ligase [Ketobacter sp. MCCC 1A13808]RLP54560.1 MAG: alanine--tRNA ligase [Ketobacter sp.]